MGRASRARRARRRTDEPATRERILEWLLGDMARAAGSVGARLIVLHIPYFERGGTAPMPAPLKERPGRGARAEPVRPRPGSHRPAPLRESGRPPPPLRARSPPQPGGPRPHRRRDRRLRPGTGPACGLARGAIIAAMQYRRAGQDGAEGLRDRLRCLGTGAAGMDRRGRQGEPALPPSRHRPRRELPRHRARLRRGTQRGLIGRVLKERREEVYVATKVPPKNRRWPAPEDVPVSQTYPARLHRGMLREEPEEPRTRPRGRAPAPHLAGPTSSTRTAGGTRSALSRSPARRACSECPSTTTIPPPPCAP